MLFMSGESYKPIKRIIDLFLSITGLVVLSPMLILLAIDIKLDSPGPVLFKQKRVGINKTHFNIYKFRTMRTDTPKDTPTHLLADPDKYITKAGRLLRKASLDELPQIINILLGQMAIIGPRMTAMGDIDFMRAQINPLRQMSPFSVHWRDIDTKRIIPMAVRKFPAKGTLKLCSALPKTISEEAHKLPTTAAFCHTNDVFIFMAKDKFFVQHHCEINDSRHHLLL